MVERRTVEGGYRMTPWEEFRADIADPPFMAQALCATADPEIFFPEPSTYPGEALAICGRCPVREECMEFAIANREVEGVWGGTTRNDRLPEIRKRHDMRIPHSTNVRRQRLLEMPNLRAQGAKAVAAEMGVDERTAFRDLEWLREREKGVA